MGIGDSLHSKRGSVFLGLAATLVVASGSLLLGYAVVTSEQGALSVAEAAVAPSSVAPEPVAASAVAAAIEEHLASEVTVRVGARSHRVAWRDLGVIVDRDEIGRAASLADGRDIVGSLRKLGAVPLAVEWNPAERRLEALKSEYDIAPHDARMDLEKRAIYPERDGSSIDVYRSIAAIEAAARSGAGEIVLRTVAIPARRTVADLGIDDISHILARFETKFSVSEYSRNFNLKLAASKLNGYVLQPGVEFSFNDVVGARTEQEGYKIAGVITAGEMVDGLAGGTCQISTTLHGAAFFAGIGIVDSTPHSRPSTYVTMGLDATVVYPHVDLKLQNDYDFPVAIHFKVFSGSAIVEILGRERPFDKVVFERNLLEKEEFDTITREDEAMPVGSMTVEQYGFYGYKIERLRKFYRDGSMVKRDRWRLRYAPVTEYARLGINPDPNLVLPEPDAKTKKKKKKRLKEPGEKPLRIEQ